MYLVNLQPSSILDEIVPFNAAAGEIITPSFRRKVDVAMPRTKNQSSTSLAKIKTDAWEKVEHTKIKYQ